MIMSWYLTVSHMGLPVHAFFGSSSNFNELVKGVRTLAALLADQADAAQMLGSAKKLASSTQKLLTAVLPEENAVRPLFVLGSI